jgi:uncharacterized membrane protein YozB (DUF420 family)
VVVLIVTPAEVHDWMAFVNLIIQITVFLLLVASLWLKKKKNFVWHGNTMLVAVIVNGLSLVAHMGPSFVNLFRDEIPNLEPVALLGLIHGIVGAIAELLGIWLVATWAYVRSDTKYCAGKRELMRLIFAFWVVALALGFLYYPFD